MSQENPQSESFLPSKRQKMAKYRDFFGQLDKLQPTANWPLKKEEKDLELFFNLSFFKRLRLEKNLHQKCQKLHSCIQNPASEEK